MKEFCYPQIDMKRTGELLRYLSSHKGLSVKDIQESLGLASNQAVYDWFNGKTLPTLNNFLALSMLMQVQMEDMLILAPEQVQQHNLICENKTEYHSVTHLWFYTKMLMNKSA